MFDFTTNQLYAPKQERDAFVLGNFIHKMLHFYYRGLIEEKKPYQSLEDTVMFTEAILWNDDKYEVLNHDQKNFALNTIKEYVGYYISDDIIPLETEKLLSKLIYEDDKIAILYEGTPDLIFSNKYKTPYPMDHKSESAKRNVFGLDNQFLAYPMLTGADKIFRNAIGLQKTKSPSDKFYREMFSFPQRTIEKWKNNTIQIGIKIVESYRSNNWEGHYSMCEGNPIDRSGCMFQNICRMAEENWHYELETNFKKLEGLYYR